MAEEKQLEPVVHEATALVELEPLLPENHKCYESVLGLRKQHDYVRQIKFDFSDPFNPVTNSLYAIVSKGEGVGEADEKTWWEDVRFAFNAGHGVKENSRLVRFAPMGINDSFPGPLGNFRYLYDLNASSKKPKSLKVLFKSSKTEITFSDQPPTNATAGPSGRSVYYDANADFYRALEKFYIACLCHPDVFTKIKYSKNSLPLTEGNKVIEFARDRRGTLKTTFDERVAELKNDFADKPKKLEKSLQDAEAKYNDAVSKIYLDALKKFSDKANHRLRHEQSVVDPKTLPADLLKEGLHTFNGRRLQSVPKKELFLLDKDSFKIVADHKLFKEYKKVEKGPPKSNKRDFQAGGRKASGDSESKKPWDYYIERVNCKDPELRDNLKAAKDAGLTYEPLTVIRTFPVPKRGGGVVLDSDFVKWNPDQGTPESFLSPGAFGIPMVSVVMGFNSGPDIPYRMSIEISGFRHLTNSPVYGKRGGDDFSGDITNEYLDTMEVEDLGNLFLPGGSLPLALEAPPEEDDPSDHPTAKRTKLIAKAQAELAEAEEDLARDLEEVD